MRRYRFGRIAALLAVAYVAAVVAAGALALVTDDPELLRQLTGRAWDPGWLPFTWWGQLLVCAGGALQGWALWQVLRGRRAGAPVDRGRRVGLLRAALYLSVACTLVIRLPIPYPWWTGTLDALAQLAIVWLFSGVLAGALPRWARLLALVAGLSNALLTGVLSIAEGLELDAIMTLGRAFQLINLTYLLWLVPVLAGQARDPRWSRGTVWAGAISASLSLVSPGSFGWFSYGGYGEINYVLLLLTLLGILSVFGTVWTARTAHELTGPAGPEPRPRTGPAPVARPPWPLAAVAVVLPLIPAAVNLAHGMPAWIGPRGAIERFSSEIASDHVRLLWQAVDLLVGVGAPAVLVLAAVVRRSRALLRGTMTALTLAAAAGVVSVLTTDQDPDRRFFDDMAEERLSIYPDGLFGGDAYGDHLPGLSPLWYSAALAASALLLHVLYAGAPTRLRAYHVLPVAMALCLVPAADLERGPVTTAADCRPEPGREQEEPAGERVYVCAVRESRLLPFADTTPDQVVLAHGHRLCGIYTRGDQAELARVRQAEGVDVRTLTWPLSAICPSAAAAVRATQAEQDHEFEERQAEEQRKCDATPRHRPLIEPARAVRLKKPEWPDGALEMYEESEDGRDPSRDGVLARALNNGLVAAGGSHLVMTTPSDLHVCVTLETYDRRPPVETKGWEHVVEVGYDSPTGEMVLMDGLSGTVLPDLSLNGRKGHYRVRAHFAWFPWKGSEYGTQRLLIMAYPGKGDRAVTYRRPPRRR